jgi:IS5 family transposase
MSKNFSYKKLLRRKHQFLRLTGLSYKEFQKLIKKCSPLWQKKLDAKKLSGRPYAIGGFEDQVLCVLIYYKFYTTHFFLGCLFGVDDSAVTRCIQRIEPILANKIAIKKQRDCTEESLEAIIIDCTEQQVQRPKRGQKRHYSGKKKSHTLKTEIKIDRKSKRIVGVSKAFPGSVHDMEVRRQSEPIHRDTIVIGDSGYQGLEKEHPLSIIPDKKRKGEERTKAQKRRNRKIAQARIAVEHVFGKLKRFAILRCCYRNKRRAYNLKFNILAGIMNLKLEY